MKFQQMKNKQMMKKWQSYKECGILYFPMKISMTKKHCLLPLKVKILLTYHTKNPKQKTSTPPPRDKTIGKKYSVKSTQTTPSQLNSSPSTKTLIVSNEMEYNILDYMKKTRENITFHELSKLKHKKKLHLKELKVVPTSPLPAVVISQAAQEMGRPPSTSLNKIGPINIPLIGGRSKSHTPPFILNFEIFNRNLHNNLVDSGA